MGKRLCFILWTPLVRDNGTFKEARKYSILQRSYVMLPYGWFRWFGRSQHTFRFHGASGPSIREELRDNSKKKSLQSVAAQAGSRVVSSNIPIFGEWQSHKCEPHLSRTSLARETDHP